MKYTVEDEPFNARPSRGYHNYRCTITFERTINGRMTEEGQKEIVAMVRKLHETDMWCSEAEYSRVGKGEWEGSDVWTFEHGIDSGD